MRRGSKLNRILDKSCGVMLLAVLSLFHRKRKMPQDVKRIGILSAAALGDTLLLSGPIADIRAHFSKQELILFCSPENLAAAELVPGLDKRVVYPWLHPVQAIRRLRGEDLDLLIDFTPWPRLTAVYALLSGAHFKAGFRTPGQLRHYGYDLAVDRRGQRHELENFRLMTRALGIEGQSAPQIAIPDAPLPSDMANRNLVILHLWPSGIRSWQREWPRERWLELARRLGAFVGDPYFVITGSPGDKPRSCEFFEKLVTAGMQGCLFTGTDGLGTLCQVVLASQLVVSTNTGVMHLAAILGVPTVSINGPTNNARWGPAGRNAIGVNSPGEDCGFLDFGFEFDGNPSDCMQRISVAQVLEAVQQVLEKRTTQMKQAQPIS